MFGKVPDWAAWLAQEPTPPGTRKGVGRVCKAAKAATATLWAYEAEPNKHHGWYENEVGRIMRLGQTAQPADWEATLHGLPERDDCEA